MKRKSPITHHRLLILLGLFVLGFATVSSCSAADTIYVNNATGNDSWTGTSSKHINNTDIGPKSTIQNGTYTVNTGGTVYVADGIYQEHLIINKNLNLIGQSTTGTIIDGTNNGRSLTINTGVIATIIKFTITNGTINSTSPGGGGGGIFNAGILTIRNCNITNNTARMTVNIGTAFVLGGGIFNVGSISMKNCNISYNTATAVSTDSNAFAAGGGIYNRGFVDYENCRITNNTVSAISTKAGAVASGGGIYNSKVTLIMTNCDVTNNTAIINAESGTADGGGICNKGLFTMTVCNVTNNTAISIGSGGESQGGGIENLDIGTLTVNFCRIVNNTPQAIYNDGGGIVLSLEDNWWGSNYPNFSNLLFRIPNPSNWLYLTVKANPKVVYNGRTSLITASFNNRYNRTTVTPFIPTGDQHIPDGVPVQLDIHSWGSFINPGKLQTIILNTVNGSVSTLFYANGGQPKPDKVTVTGTVDGYTTTGGASATITIVNTHPVKPICKNRENKVGMQHTGTPPVGIILAILLILGGLITNRKKL